MLAELARPTTTHLRRALIGERLDVLGEPASRFGVGIDADDTPRIDWCAIPGGEVAVEVLPSAVWERASA